MNMKKTIAAVAAASVAVSAMAATASAELTDKTLTYNLAREVQAEKNASVTITATFSSIETFANEDVIINVYGMDYYGDSVTIKGSYYDPDGSGNSFKNFGDVVVTHASWAENYSVEGEKLLKDVWQPDLNSQIVIPVTAKNKGTEFGLVASKETNITVTAKYTKLDAKVYKDIGAVNDGLKAGKLGIQVVVGSAAAKDAVPATIESHTQGAGEVVDVSGFTGTTATTFTYNEDKAEITDATNATGLNVSKYTGGALELTYKTVVDAESNSNTVDAWVDDATGRVVDLATLGIEILGTGVVLNTASSTSGTDATTITIYTDVAGIITAISASGGGTSITPVTPDGSLTLDDGNGNVIDGAKNLVGAKLVWDTNANAFVGKGSDGSTLVVQKDSVLASGTPAGAAGGSSQAASHISIKPAGWTPNPASLGVKITNDSSCKDGDYIIVTPGTPAVAATARWTSAISGTSSKYTAGGFVVAPYRSDLTTSGTFTYRGINNNAQTLYRGEETPNLYSNAGDIITYLETQSVNAGATKANKDATAARNGTSDNFGTYTNVAAVLNDAVQNYDVTFTFNTATQGIRLRNNDIVDAKGNWIPYYTSNTWEDTYTDMYKAFGQQLYPLYDVELTTFTGMDWAGVNLFAGALVINGGLTMSLSNTEYFDWTKTSISFSWDDIVDAAAEKGITSDYALTIQSMGLITSQTWFWDSMDVVLAVRSEDDASADAGIDSDDDVIDDEDIDEGEDIEVEEETPAETEAVVAPVEATSPKTGNASVALAVIPVALAAAAVVAKKRG